MKQTPFIRLGAGCDHIQGLGFGFIRFRTSLRPGTPRERTEWELIAYDMKLDGKRFGTLLRAVRFVQAARRR